MADTHLMAQVAACRAGVGIARWPEPRLFELRGPLAAHPASARAAGGWWRRQSAHRALFLAEPRDGLVVAFGPDLVVTEISRAHAALIVAGPPASRLAARLAGAVMVAGDGEHHRILVVRASCAQAAWQLLLAEGRSFGAVAVDVAAIELYRAAQRAPRHGGRPDLRRCAGRGAAR
jgi:hypothetical protein